MATEPTPAKDAQNILTAAKGGGITFAGTLLEYVGRFILGIMLGRWMGARHYGLYNLADSATYMVMGVALLGLDTALVYSIPRRRYDHTPGAMWGMAQVGLGVPLLVSLIGGLGLLAFAHPIAVAFFHEPDLAPLLRMVALAIPCGTLGAAAASIIQGYKQMHYRIIGHDITMMVVKLVLVAAFAFTGLTAFKAIGAYTLAMLVSCGVLLYFVYKVLPPYHPPTDQGPALKAMLKFSLPIYLMRLLPLFGAQLRTLLLGALSTVTSVGIFAAAARISIIGTAFLNSVEAIAMPIISELHAKKDMQQLGHFYQTMGQWVFAFNIPVFLAIVFFARPILSIFGESFSSGVLVLILIACGNLISGSTGTCGIMVTMTGNTWLNAANSLATLVITLSLNLLLIPRLGMIGAALATATGIGLINLTQVIEVYVLFRLLPYHWGFLKPLGAGLLTAGFTYLLTRYGFPNANLLEALLGIAALSLVYAGLLWAMGLSPEDRLILDRVFSRLTRRIPWRKTPK